MIEVRMHFCIDTDEELVDIEPHIIHAAILNKIIEFQEDPDNMFRELEQVRDFAPAVSGSDKRTKHSSFFPVSGDEVHLLQFNRKKKIREERPNFINMTLKELVFYILKNDWTSAKDIAILIFQRCRREISPHSVRRILSQNSSEISKRKGESGYMEYKVD